MDVKPSDATPTDDTTSDGQSPPHEAEAAVPSQAVPPPPDTRLDTFPEFVNQSQDLLEQWRHERTITSVYFNHIGSISGNMVAGQGNIHQYGVREADGAGKLRVGRVLYEEMVKLKKVFLPHPPCDTARSMLETMPLLFLSGHASMGKSSAAIYLLSSMSEHVYELDPTHRLDEWLGYTFQPNHGYWLNVTTADAIQGWNPFLLQQLCEHLRVNSSRLIITLDAKVPVTPQSVATFLIPWEPPTDGNQLLQRHLQWYASFATEPQIAELLANEDIQALLTRSFLPGEIDQLARLLAEVLQQKMDLADALDHFAARAEQRVATWFLNHPDPKERTYLLSVAILSGAPLVAVEEAQRRLADLLLPAVGESTTPGAVDPYGEARLQRLQMIGAQLGTGTAFTDFGRMPVKTIQLNNLAFQQAVLPYVWAEYDQQVRDPLRQWFGELVHARDLEIRIRIATAVGSIARHDEFVHVVNSIIRPWANDPEQHTRAAAALALSFPAWDSLTAPAVLKLLHHWSSIPNIRLNHTALLAWGGWVGQRYIDFACDNLYLIACHQQTELIFAWVNALLMLFEGGQSTPEHYFTVLPALTRWMADKHSRFVQLLAMTAFDAIASMSRVTDPSEDSQYQWYTLLWLVAQNADIERLLTETWRTLLRDTHFRRIGLETLRQWILSHDAPTSSKRSYRALKRLLYQIMAGGSEADHRRLHFYLERWARLKPTSVTVIRLYQELFRH